jgi:ribonuclease P protein component
MVRFTKSERLKSKKTIDQLFTSKDRFYQDPFFVIWQDDAFESNVPVRILISVSKKKHRKASRRNYIKRRIREAYRHNKQPFIDFLNRNQRHCTLAVVYTSGTIMEYQEIERKIYWMLKRLQKEYEKDHW